VGLMTNGGFVENQGFKVIFYSDAIVRGGAAYLLNKDMQIDAQWYKFENNLL
jgi:hypothetical protein